MVPFIARLFLYGIIFIYSYIYCSEQVKIPSQCEALSALRPVQIVGGEQTLFAVTAEGKVRISPCSLIYIHILHRKMGSSPGNQHHDSMAR